MSRRNRNNRYNSRNRNKWDEGYDDEYFDDDDQLESEDDDSSEEQDEYEDEEYEEEEYDSDDEEYEDDESDDEDYDDEEYDQDDEEEYDEDESDDEEYDEDDEEEYDEDESEEEESDEDDDVEDDEEDDELDSEIEAAAESTAKKTIGNSDLLSKLRGQMRPQIKDEPSESSKDIEINVSPLSLFGQPISQNDKKNNASSVPPQHANARIVQTVTVGSKPSQAATVASVQKAASGRVITAQSQNGASVTSVQPRDLAAEKAEAEKKQKEKERLEQEKKTKEEKSNRILDKFKGKNSSAASKTKAGAAWAWSKITSGAVWIWTGIAACFLWVFWSKPRQAWQTWRVFKRSWWSGIGTGVWNAVKKPFVKKPVEAAQTDGAEAVPSGAAIASAASESSVPASVGRKKSRKKNVDIWDAESTSGSEPNVNTDAFASKEPDSRRRLYFSLSSIGAAAIVFLLVLPSMLNGSKKSDENAVALNKQEEVSDVSNQAVNKLAVNSAPASENGFRNREQGMTNQYGAAGRNGYNTPPRDARSGFQASGTPSNFNAVSHSPQPGYQTPASPLGASAFDNAIPEVPDLSANVPDVTTPDVTDLGMDISEPAAPEVTDLGLDDSAAVPELSNDEIPVPDNIETDIPAPDMPDPELEAPSVDLETPEIPDVTMPAGNDPLNDAAPDVPGDSALENSDLTEPAEVDIVPAPDLTPSDEPVSDPTEIQNPEIDVPDLSMPDLSDSQPVDSNPENAPDVPEPTIPEPEVPEPTIPEPDIPEPTVPEPTVPEPTVPEPTVPEPTEPNALETGVASQLSEPEQTPETPLTPEVSLPNDSLLADSPTEYSPADSSVELGAPGPLVSSANAAQSGAQAQKTANVNSSLANNAPSADAGYGANDSSASYANNNNSSSGYNNQVYVNTGVYTVQPNDSFWTIARRVYGSGEYARALAQYNSSRVNLQSLTVSAQIMTPSAETLQQQYPELCPARSITSASAPSSAAVPDGTRVYIVDQEESVMEIARRELGSILYCSQVYALNQEQLSGNVDRVKPGVRLLLPIQK